MNIKSGLVSLLLLFPASLEFLEARVPEGGQPLTRPANTTIPPTDPDDSSVLRQQAVVVNIALARDKATTRLRLPLFDAGSALNLVLKSRKTSLKDSVVWVGRVEGQEGSAAIFAVGKKVLVGNFMTQPTAERPSDYYEIEYLGNGLHVLRKYAPWMLAPDSDPIPPRFDQARRDGPRSGEPGRVWKAAFARGALVPPPACTSDTGGTIDALIVYTAAARDKAAALDKSVGAEAIEEAIVRYIAEANDSYERSGITQQQLQLRLVHTELVNYDESKSDPKSDALKLQQEGGDLADVHGIRDRFGADIVGLIVEYTKRQTDAVSCGQAFQMLEPSTDFERFAFAAIPRRCAARTMGVAHEFGHLMGARHDPTNANNEPGDPNKPFPFSHGYVHVVKPPPSFRTIMAKNDRCSGHRCDLVPYWSNPLIKHPVSGEPMGCPVLNGLQCEDEKSTSDDAQTLTLTAPIVANFRCHVN